MTEALFSLSRVTLALAALLVIVRAVRGPSILDRLLALETIALTLVGYLLLESTAGAGRPGGVMPVSSAHRCAHHGRADSDRVSGPARHTGADRARP